MIKLLLAGSSLGAGAAGFLAAHRSTTLLQHETSVITASWQAQTRLIAAGLDEQAELLARARELKSTLSQTPVPKDNPLWSALKTDGPGRLTPELRQRLLEELHFNWQSSDEYVIATKAAVRELELKALQGDKLTDTAATLLTVTSSEREKVDSTIQQVQTAFNTWAMAHTRRTEPAGEVVAQYTLEGDPSVRSSLSNALTTGIFEAVGPERAQFIVPSARNWLTSLVRNLDDPYTMVVTRYNNANGQGLRAQFIYGFGTTRPLGNLVPKDLSECWFPTPFLPLFPNGWADVAKREGFQLPQGSQSVGEENGTP